MIRSHASEWLSLNGFRANKLFADRGFVEYAVVAQHRESWQEIGQVRLFRTVRATLPRLTCPGMHSSWIPRRI